MYLIVLNIPKSFSSKALRNYFFDYIEKSAFHTFHFRHRPEHQFVSFCSNLNFEKINESSLRSYVKNKSRSETENTSTCCLLNAKLDYSSQIQKYYNNKYWVDESGTVLKEKCIIYSCQELITISKSLSNEIPGKYFTRKEIRENVKILTFNDIEKNIELLPPHVMPYGNIGTHRKYFTELVKSCQLPSSIIEKLGLQSIGKRVKKYGTVPFNYGTCLVTSSEDSEDDVYTGRGDFIPTIYYEKKITKQQHEPQLELIDEGEDGNEVEEWDRYESFHDDVTKQGRTKERIYEPEIELMWEKGGPGLVFYTDAQFWKQQEGDFDEQTTDEWDVDMSGYYEEGAGDKDARDSLAMQEIKKLKLGGHSSTVFRKPKSKKPRNSDDTCDTIGKFEEYTKGFGRRFMEAQGWQDGKGLGKGNKGMAYALDEEGQLPADKKGFGYHGERIINPQGSTITRSVPKKRKPVLIGTVYDHLQRLDPPTKIHRTAEPTRLSYRSN